jgi:hypothetical protein
VRHRRLAQGTRVCVNAILITEKFGNMHITTTRGLYNAITVERADIDDLMTALNQHLAGGKIACIGSIMVAQAFGNLKITTTHTPSNTIMIAPGDIDDLTAALDEALAHREGPP